VAQHDTAGPERDRPGHPWHERLQLEPELDELGRPLGVDDRDPLAGRRGEDHPALDVLCAGTVFYDLIFTGLESPPALGRELWTRGMGSSPGGIANLAVGLRRLGLRTGLASCFGEDLYGDFCWETLAGQEGVDLTLSRRCPGWHSPVTVSLAYDRDRAMVTHGHEPPLSADDLVLAARPDDDDVAERAPVLVPVLAPKTVPESGPGTWPVRRGPGPARHRRRGPGPARHRRRGPRW